MLKPLCARDTSLTRVHPGTGEQLVNVVEAPFVTNLSHQSGRGGGVTLQSNTSGAEVGGNQVSGTEIIANTCGMVPWDDASATELESSAISGSLTCTSNTLAPIDDGMPNTVRGARTGQCGPSGF